MEFSTVLSIIVGVLGVLTSFAYSLVQVLFKKKHKVKSTMQKSKTDIAVKIKNISDLLSESATELTDMQGQLKERIAFVENLNAQAKKAESIAALNQEQINVINEILSNNLKKEGKRSFWQGVIVNFVFFVLGAVASYLISVYLL